MPGWCHFARFTVMINASYISHYLSAGPGHGNLVFLCWCSCPVVGFSNLNFIRIFGLALGLLLWYSLLSKFGIISSSCPSLFWYLFLTLLDIISVYAWQLISVSRLSPTPCFMKFTPASFGIGTKACKYLLFCTITKKPLDCLPTLWLFYYEYLAVIF